jgi:N-acetylglucosaminyldiphosphoundecaprenol N-acetyl-beta-D-mannosaminyltransferase
MTPRHSVLGCPVDVLDPAEFRASLPEMVGSDRLTDIVTLNPEQIMAARRDPETAALIHHADVCTVDGIGLALALRLQGIKDVRRITGVDLIASLAEQRIPLYLLGGAPGAAEQSAHCLTTRFRGAQIAGSWSGGRHSAQDDQQSVARIALSGARAVAVAYGAPAQTAWIERNRADLEAAGVRIAIGVGGALDYYAGYARLAPNWMRRIGFEWLYRLASEPWRIRRQLVLPWFALLAFGEAVRFRLGRL